MICLEPFEDLIESGEEDNEICSLLPCFHRFCYACVSQLVEQHAFQNRKGQFIRLKKSNLGTAVKKRTLACPICRKTVKKVERSGSVLDKSVFNVGEIVQKKQSEFNEKIKESIKSMQDQRELRPYQATDEENSI